jgi:hypothetical protein
VGCLRHAGACISPSVILNLVCLAGAGYLGRAPYWLQYIAEAEAAAELAPPPASRDADRVVLASAPCSRRCRPGTPWSAWWWLGSYQGCSEGLHALAREVAEERARTEWRQMGARSEHEALGIFVHGVHRRWGSVFWRSWARVIRGRLPAIGRPNAEILHHGEEVV